MLKLLSLWVLSLWTVPAACGQPAQKRKPNIIYIYADDLGYGELGVYGQKKIRTPHLDKLAAEGIRFTRHYTSTPVCAPARCMLLTGRHGGHSFIRGNYELGGFKDDEEGGQMPLPEGTVTIAGVLKQAPKHSHLCDYSWPSNRVQALNTSPEGLSRGWSIAQLPGGLPAR